MLLYYYKNKCLKFLESNALLKYCNFENYIYAPLERKAWCSYFEDPEWIFVMCAIFKSEKYVKFILNIINKCI